MIIDIPSTAEMIWFGAALLVGAWAGWKVGRASLRRKFNKIKS